eukprot:TRINITY_DN1170_c0_g1_i2.p1 TRINITY_DN1170_c0_g1~~TRINITY_DN1170_c0_g1_i2.p1  ORF type:complete len:126 (-),score=23.59 TRINITY_DN1170_c0_g1_i2:49-426(-)
MRDQYIRCGDGFLIIYSVTNLLTYTNVDGYKDQILRVKDEANYFPIVICGNKCDLENDRRVDFNEAKAHFNEMGFVFYETSAKTKINVDVVFSSLIEEIMKYSGEIFDNDKKKKKKILFQGCVLL